MVKYNHCSYKKRCYDYCCYEPCSYEPCSYTTYTICVKSSNLIWNTETIPQGVYVSYSHSGYGSIVVSGSTAPQPLTINYTACVYCYPNLTPTPIVFQSGINTLTINFQTNTITWSNGGSSLNQTLNVNITPTIGVCNTVIYTISNVIIPPLL
jgi:hypothetical protein